jgi:hypothetical protein
MVSGTSAGLRAAIVCATWPGDPAVADLLVYEGFGYRVGNTLAGYARTPIEPGTWSYLTGPRSLMWAKY